MVAINRHYNKEQRMQQQTMKVKKFTPLGKMVVIDPIRHSGILESGIAVGEGSDVVTHRAWVVAVGPECKTVKEGDQIILFGGSQVLITRFDGDELHHIREEMVAGIVDEKYQ